VVTILRRLRGFFNSIVNKTFDPQNFTNPVNPNTNIENNIKKDDILYQKDDIIILKGEANKKD